MVGTRHRPFPQGAFRTAVSAHLPAAIYHGHRADEGFISTEASQITAPAISAGSLSGTTIVVGFGCVLNANRRATTRHR
jgi:hypothetical protein